MLKYYYSLNFLDIFVIKLLKYKFHLAFHKSWKGERLSYHTKIYIDIHFKNIL